MPSATAAATAGATASESCASTMMALAPWLIRLSMSVSCLDADDWASAEMYLSPLASITALMAASSVFQRSSWKLFHETPIVRPAACAAEAALIMTVVHSRTAASFFIHVLPNGGALRPKHSPNGGLASTIRLKHFFNARKNDWHASQSGVNVIFDTRNKCL